MNKEQVAHMARIHESFLKDHTDKFIKGAAEHKTELHTDFTKEQLLDFALEEVLDLVSYLYTLKELMK
jgi:hypothetical protein